MEKETQKRLLRLEKEKVAAKQKNKFKEVAEICNYKGELYSSNSYFKEALEEHSEELKYCRKSEDILGEGIAYRKIGECYSMMEQFSTALENAFRYYKLMEGIKNDLEIQRAWTTIGRIYFLQYSSEKSSSALKCAKAATKKSLLAAEKLKNEVKERDLNEMLCRSYMNLALIYEASDSDECVKFFEQAIIIGRKYALKEEMIRCQLNLGNHYLKTKTFTAALKIFDDSIKVAKESNNKAELSEAYVGKGQTLLCTTDFTGASYYFKKAYFSRFTDADLRQKAHHLSKYTSQVLKGLKRLSETKVIDEKVEICEKLGDCFAELKCYRSALKYYEQQLQLAISLKKSKDVIATIHVSLGQTFLDNKQFIDALHHFREERTLRKGNVIEQVQSSLKIIEAMIGLNTKMETIKEEYKFAINNCGNNKRLKRTVLEDYLTYLKNENVSDTKIDEVDKTIKELSNEEEEEEDNQSDIVVDLSEPSDFTDSDSDNEENSIASRKNRRKRVGRNEKGETPLHRACIAGNFRQVKQLIEKGHSVNERDHCGWLPIHEAANYGYADIVEFLVENGADINDRGGRKCEGITPLHDACINGHLNVVKVLLKKGANVTAQDNSGTTALDCLENYREKTNDLSANEEAELLAILKDLRFAMEKLNYDFSERKRPQKKQNRLLPFVDVCEVEKSGLSLRKAYCGDEEFEDPFVDDYAQTISNLRHSSDIGHTDKRRRLSPNFINEPLLDESKVVDDWLEDDIGDSRKRSIHLRQSRKRRKEIEDCDTSNDGFEDSRDENVAETNTASDIIIEKEHIAYENVQHHNTVSSNYLSYVDKSETLKENREISDFEKHLKKNIYIRVQVNDVNLCVVVESDSTMKNLAEETAKRYYEQKHVMPTLSIKTKDGALLSNNDLVATVVVVEGNQLYAGIESCESQPLDQRYADKCKELSVEKCVQIEAQLRVAFETGILNLRNFYMRENQLKPLSNAIKLQETVQCLDISYSNILIVDVRNELLGIVTKLPNLQRLNLECTALTNSKLKFIANSGIKVAELNLSYNSLRNTDALVISEILTKCSSLMKLNLQHCEFDEKCAVEDCLTKALSNTSVSEVTFQSSSQLKKNVSNDAKLNFKCNYSSALKIIQR